MKNRSGFWISLDLFINLGDFSGFPKVLSRLEFFQVAVTVNTPPTFEDFENQRHIVGPKSKKFQVTHKTTLPKTGKVNMVYISILPYVSILTAYFKPTPRFWICLEYFLKPKPTLSSVVSLAPHCDLFVRFF